MGNKKQTLFRIIFMLLGTMLIGIGIAFYRLTELGNDAFSALNFSLFELTTIPYTACNFIVSAFLFIPMIIYERKRINIGTFVNMIFVGVVVDLVLLLANKLNLNVAEYNIVYKILIASVGVFIEVFGISLYVTADFGIAPYDAVPIILQKKLHINFKIARWITDGSCVVTAFVISNLILRRHAVGLFTLVTLICVSPLLNLFNNILKKAIYKNDEELHN